MATSNTDIHDSEKDEEKLKPETFTIDLPDVSDIPGQENIVIPQMKEMQDVTIASDDEEGVGLFGDDDKDEDTELAIGNDADISSTEKEMLHNASTMQTDDDRDVTRATPDNTDEEGEPLNENSADTLGTDLDTSGIDEDDDMENIGEEDEENNAYSLGGDENENNNDTVGNP